MLCLDRSHPSHATAPPMVVITDKGEPPVGVEGFLFSKVIEWSCPGRGRKAGAIVLASGSAGAFVATQSRPTSLINVAEAKRMCTSCSIPAGISTALLVDGHICLVDCGRASATQFARAGLVRRVCCRRSSQVEKGG
jgi:hypothetical protein